MSIFNPQIALLQDRDLLDYTGQEAQQGQSHSGLGGGKKNLTLP
jgi:hypothetical protein